MGSVNQDFPRWGRRGHLAGLGAHVHIEREESQIFTGNQNFAVPKIGRSRHPPRIKTLQRERDTVRPVVGNHQHVPPTCPGSVLSVQGKMDALHGVEGNGNFPVSSLWAYDKVSILEAFEFAAQNVTIRKRELNMRCTRIPFIRDRVVGASVPFPQGEILKDQGAILGVLKGNSGPTATQVFAIPGKHFSIPFLYQDVVDN